MSNIEKAIVDKQRKYQSISAKLLLATLNEEVEKRLPELPVNWTGIEIRFWIADLFASQTLDESMLTGKRKSDYKADCVRNKLL